MSRATLRRAAALALLRFLVAVVAYGLCALLYRNLLDGAGRPGFLAVLAATAIVAVVLWLVDDTVGRLADRLIFGSGAHGQRAVRRLLQRMASTLPVDEVVPRLAEAAGRSIGGARAEVRVLLADGQHWSQTWPPDARAADGYAMSVDVRHAGTSIGQIEVDTADDASDPGGRRLLDELAAPAGLALSTVRLTFELRHRIAEFDEINAAVRASSARMLTAGRDEQRRLEREVDDHVMRELDAVELALCSPTTPPVLHAASAHCERALDELRVIARGIFPPRLGDAGLLVSIDGWLERARLHAEVAASGTLQRLRNHLDLEACLYFCAVTALEAFGASDYGRLAVHVEEVATQITVQISGAGGQSLPVDAVTVVRDRVEAFDGELAVSTDDSPIPTTMLICRAPLPVGAAAPQVGSPA